jgi:hypothetical protein
LLLISISELKSAKVYLSLIYNVPMGVVIYRNDHFRVQTANISFLEAFFHEFIGDIDNIEENLETQKLIRKSQICI